MFGFLLPPETIAISNLIWYALCRQSLNVVSVSIYISIKQPANENCKGSKGNLWEEGEKEETQKKLKNNLKIKEKKQKYYQKTSKVKASKNMANKENLVKGKENKEENIK